MKRLLEDYKTLSNQTQYLKMIVANIINRFGDSIDAIAFTWLVYELTHSALWSTIVFGVNMLPTILIQPFAGALVERMRKRNVMVVCDAARGICVSMIAVFYLLGILTPWMLLAVTFLNSSLEALRVPAGIAIVPKLLDEDHYDTGIALNSSLSRVMELIGTGCAGFIIAAFGISSAIFIDAFTFFASGVIIALIRYQETTSDTKLSIASYVVTLQEGFRYVLNSQAVRIICIIGAFLNMVIVPLNSLLPSYIDEVLKGGSETLSLLSISITVGSIIGSFFYPYIARMLSKRAMLLGCFLICGLFFLLIIAAPSLLPWRLVSYAIVIALFVVLGLASSAISTYVSVFLTANVDPDYMARVGAVFNASVSATIPVCTILISAVLQITSFINIMLAAGFFSILLTLLMLPLKSIRVLDEKRDIIETV